MVVKHSKTWWAGRLAAETEHASGSGAVARTPTKLSALTSMAYPFAYDRANMFPYTLLEKEEIEDNADDVMGGIYWTGGVEHHDGTRSEFVQDTFYWDKVKDALDNHGEIPTTYALHWQNHLFDSVTATNNHLRWESYGCYVKELKLILPENEMGRDNVPHWEITDACYSTESDTEDGTGVDSLGKQGWLPINANPFYKSFPIKVGTATLGTLSGELDIALEYDERKDGGDIGATIPTVASSKATFTLHHRSKAIYESTLEAILKTAALEDKFDIKIDTKLTDTVLQISDMVVREVDLAGIPDRGVVDFDLTFIQTKDTALTTEAVF